MCCIFTPAQGQQYPAGCMASLQSDWLGGIYGNLGCDLSTAAYQILYHTDYKGRLKKTYKLSFLASKGGYGFGAVLTLNTFKYSKIILYYDPPLSN